MKSLLLTILKKLGVYHPLQRAFRQGLRSLRIKKARRKYAALAGSGFLCNVCGHSYKKFIDDLPSHENSRAIAEHKVIAGYGQNVICPNCFSTARERLLLLVLNEHFNVEGKSILHLSPEKNVYDYLKLKANVVSADLHPGFYKHIDAGTREVDLMRLPFEDAMFDIVIGNHILEHIPDDRKAMAETFRVLKAGGRAILQVPYSENIFETIEDPQISDPKEQSRLFGQKDHVRIYFLDDYIRRLESAGFIIRLLHSHELELYSLHAIQPGEHFLFIYKPPV